MEKTRATQIEALRDQFQKHGVRKVKLGGFDVDGILRGKYLSLEKFWSAAEGGLGFCDVVFGWDMSDQLYDNATVTGWHTGYPDVRATIDLSTFRVIPWEPGTAAFLLDFESEPGKPLLVSPRQLLKRIDERARSMGFSVKVASEYEFFLFRETPESDAGVWQHQAGAAEDKGDRGIRLHGRLPNDDGFQFCNVKRPANERADATGEGDRAAHTRDASDLLQAATDQCDASRGRFQRQRAVGSSRRIGTLRRG